MAKPESRSSRRRDTPSAEGGREAEGPRPRRSNRLDGSSRALHRAPRIALDRRQHLQGQGRQRPARARGRVRGHRPREERLPARRRHRHAGRRGGPPRPRRAGKGKRITELLKPGQEILVQAIKDPLKTKGPRLSMQLSIAGRYLVYVPQGEGVGVSRRLDDKERDRLRKRGQGARPGRGRRDHPHRRPGGEEARGLRARDQVPPQALRGAQQARGGRPPRRPWSSRRPTCRCASCATSSRSSSSARSSTTRSSTTAWTSFFTRTAPELRRARRALQGREAPLFERYGVEQAIQSTLERRVDLPSGGYLIIDYAEALTVIDVNSGSFTGRGKGARLEDTITKTNLEAAEEVVAPAAAARHRRDHRHRLHRHVAGPQPRRGAEDAAQGARRGPHQDLRGGDLAARAWWR